MKWDINKLSVIAKERGGKIIDKEYDKLSTKYNWKCSKGHQWQASALNVVFSKSWCPFCARKAKPSLDRLSEIASSKGGEFLSDSYINNSSKVKWKCKIGHIFEMTYNMVDQGQWCPYCAGRYIWNPGKSESAARFDEVANIVKGKLGKVIAGSYRNRKTKFTIQCRYGHSWEATYDKIKQGRWCKYCASGVREEICRKIFEKITGMAFTKLRPKWLTINGFRHELDGYCPRLNIAFEHQGSQHYKCSKYLRYNAADVTKQRKADKQKLQLCQNKGIQIIYIPYHIRVNNLVEYILRQFSLLGLSRFVVNSVTKIHDIEAADDRLENIMIIAKSKGGKCKSKMYLGRHGKLIFECKNKHQWEATAGSIMSGKWCIICAGKAKKTDRDIIALAKMHGGKWTGGKYVNSRSILIWKCNVGHVWSAPYYKVQQGRWCKMCRKLTQIH